MEELATGTQLKNDIVILPGLREIDQLDDVGMVQLSHDLDFFQDVRSLQQK
jgi:hypothetical protein